MKLSHAYISVILLFTLFSCGEKSINELQFSDKDGVFQAIITHSAGNSWSSSDEFLPLPMNIADVNGKSVFLLSDREKKGSELGVTVLGAVKLIENDSITTYVLAIPLNDIKRELMLRALMNFQPFIVVQNG